MDEKYLIGSQFLKLENCRDTDYLFTGEPRISLTLKENESYLPLKFFYWYKDFLNGPEDSTEDSFAIFTLYQFSQGWRPDFPVKFEMLDHRKKWIKILQNYMNSEMAKQTLIAGGRPAKKLYHIAFQYYILKENTYHISKEGRELAQQIHDFGIQEDTFFELKNKLDALEV